MAKTIYVSLEKEKIPPVRVDPVIWGKPKMKWRKEKNSEDFNFVGITDLPESFEVTKCTDSKINVTDGMVSGDYEYTITVTHNGDTYSTTVTTQSIIDGKPVIRN